ncbi:hypothetical protein K490DRAFT_37933 [Saccharata proteae CBS 121410]|uniref:C2H2-type domain-containing protein n=1 Tax=Saccharata proteae CBS 121410 TaxID=1314787 RepID=A0A6A5YAS1_9PEZI|nr:hypothetical protein K490DRAFT_37933 [Saccharata proteae CBS 121410]
MSNQGAVFDRVLELFKDKLSDDDASNFGVTTLEDLQKAIDEIQKKQASSRKMQNLNRLRPFLDAMDHYGKVIEVFVNTSDYLAFVWVRWHARTTKIGENLPQLAQFQILFKETSQMNLVLTQIFEDVLDFHWVALKYFKQRTWKQLFQATWPSFKPKITKILNNMRRHKSLIESQADLVHFEQLQQLRASEEVEFRHLKEAEDLRRRKEVDRWLSGASADIIHEKCQQAREDLPDSGKWIFDIPLFKTWFSLDFCSTTLLWLSGMPGSGALIVDEARRLSVPTVAYFYCRYEDAQRKTFIALARTILAQVLCQNEDLLLPLLFDRASKSGEITLTRLSVATELLDIALRTTKKTYIILDGLDECSRDERKMITTWFQNLISSVAPADTDSLRCLFVCQDDGPSRKDLSMVPNFKLHESDNRRDIADYAAFWSRKIQSKFDLTDSKTQDIGTMVTKEANGAVSIDLDEGAIDYEGRHIRVHSKDLCGSLVEVFSDETVSFVHSSARRYLVVQKYVDIASEELAMACLCIGYLNIPTLEQKPSQDVLLQGCYIFYDYAVAHWAGHLEAAVEQASDPNALTELAETVENFLSIHFRNPDDSLTILTPVYDRLQPLLSYDFLDFGSLVQAVAAFKKESATYGDTWENRTLDLSAMTLQLREFSENLVTPSTISASRSRLQTLYGKNLFKCPKINCQFFYQGYYTKVERDEHVAKHSRAFLCSVSGCPHATLGFASAPELKSHLATAHKGVTEFPADLMSGKDPKNEKDKLNCLECGRLFTTKSNLRAHSRTHSGERPFKCNTCNSSFARDFDCQRHKMTHTDQRIFVCHGSLKDGTTWGCGSSFSRRSTLDRHCNSPRGRGCNRPRD